MSETVGLTQGLAAPLGPGRVIAGKYRLEDELGRGSMGIVFRAVHVTLGQRVAIKLISSEHSQSPEARRRFSMEAKAAAKLRSRHVVQVYDDGETPEGNAFIVLELLEGETLEQRLQRERDLSLADSTRVVSHVGRALARAHAAGIVHRDLKPANIFLVKAEEEEGGFIAKVLDFGIAKLDAPGESGTTQAGTVLGTPLFMSPEQVRGASSVDYRADLYSLGMCLYQMLTGELAFYAPSYSDILLSICTQPLPSLRAKAPWVPDAVERWFQRACAKDPLERFQSADEMTEALRAAAGVIPPPSKHQSSPEGRIAPETLVGFASPPALSTRLPEVGPGRTQQLSPVAIGATTTPGLGAAPGERPLQPIAIAAPSSHGRLRSAEIVLPKSSLRPLLLGAGLGLLVLAAVALTLALWREPSPPVAPTSAATSATAPAPSHEPASAPPPAQAVSSVAAPPAPVATTSAPQPEAARPAGPKRAAPAKRPAEPKPSSTDLGF